MSMTVEAIKMGFQARGIEVEVREGQDAGRALRSVDHQLGF